MPGLLYPAYQKFYSAISCLERFGKENDFFSNIANLDTFFSEYRSITLVMQKSLAHTSHIEFYKEASTDYFDSWLNTQRVKAVHTHPVEYSKKIDVTVFFPDGSFDILSQTFTIENDTPFEKIAETLKSFFKRMNPNEVFFSAKYTFLEKDSAEDVLSKALNGIATMHNFMEIMYRQVGESCVLCEQLRDKIKKSTIFHIPIDFKSVDDYIYYPHKDEFERAGRFALVMGCTTGEIRSPLSGLNMFGDSNDGDYFTKFVVMHAVIGTTDLMPTIMTVYRDKTFRLDTFHADIKTTFYRKIKETADAILAEDIQEVYCMMTYVLCGLSEEFLGQTSKERLAQSAAEFLTFMKVDSDLNEEEYYFPDSVIGGLERTALHIRKGPKKTLDFGKKNMYPIVEAFKKKGFLKAE